MRRRPVSGECSDSPSSAWPVLLCGMGGCGLMAGVVSGQRGCCAALLLRPAAGLRTDDQTAAVALLRLRGGRCASPSFVPSSAVYAARASVTARSQIHAPPRWAWASRARPGRACSPRPGAAPPPRPRRPGRAPGTPDARPEPFCAPHRSYARRRPACPGGRTDVCSARSSSAWSCWCGVRHVAVTCGTGAGPGREEYLQLADDSVEARAGAVSFGDLFSRCRVQKAWATETSVTWWCQPGQVRPSKWAKPRACFISR